MILTVTLNAAIDTTYRTDRFAPSDTNRVDLVSRQAGGKGVNVARLLHAWGQPVIATGLAGGAAGRWIAADLADRGVDVRFAAVAGESRTTTVVVDASGEATTVSERGPVVSPEEWAAFRALHRDLVGQAALVVLSGSLPRGVPATAYAQLVADARQEGVGAIVDADGPALRAALEQRPYVVKPNADELRRVTGIDDPLAAASVIGTSYGVNVVASLGARGLLLWTADAVVQASGSPLTGNPTGAGDAVVAALAAGTVRGDTLADCLRDAVALSAAAVLQDTAGTVDMDDVRRLRPGVTLTHLAAAGRAS